MQREEVIWAKDDRGEFAILPLTQGLSALIDREDYAHLGHYHWHAGKCGNKTYARRFVSDRGKRRCIFMHRAILGEDAGDRVDHEDGDGLNNRKYNLRSCTRSQNAANTPPPRNNRSGYRGVSWSARDNCWVAQIKHQGKHIYITNATDPVYAARAYDAKAVEIFGPFAKTNFPDVDLSLVVRERHLQRNNTSGYRGVTYDASRDQWRASVTVSGRTTRCGIHETAEQAAQAREKVVQELDLPPRYRNFPERKAK